jgi:AraC family transcriptional regulator of arabinose operon
MWLDWEAIQVRLGASGVARWHKGVEVDPRWPGRSHKPNARKFFHFHLQFYWAGRGRMITREGEVEIQPSTCLWLKPGWDYEVWQDPANPLGTTFVDFYLLDLQGNPLPAETPQPPDLLHPLDANLVNALTRRVVELTHGMGSETSTPHAGAARAAQLLFTGLLIDLDAASDVPQAAARGGTRQLHYTLMSGVAARLRENPQQAPSIKMLSREVGYSPDHLTRVFKQTMGVGPRELAIQSRLDSARQLLSQTSMSIGKIASTLGYSDIYFFSRQFKSRTGQTPSQYRQSQQPRRDPPPNA